MKARVIKEWEMYGITHKVGEIMDIPLHSPSGLPMISDRDAFLLDNGFIEEIKEPLIKDEKVRKAIRAWAEANEIITVEYDEYWVSFRRDDKTISFKDEDRRLGFYELENSRDYTIDELCGEEEE